MNMMKNQKKRAKKSSYHKGNQYEREVKAVLERSGWKVEGQHRKAMWIYKKLLMIGRDIFGCDLIAKKREERTLWVQVSTRANKSNKIRQVENEPWCSDFDRVQVWCRQPKKKEYVVFEYPSWEQVGYYFVNAEKHTKERRKKDGRRV